MKLSLLACLLLAAGAAVHARDLQAAPAPARMPTSKLAAPCIVPDSWYPLRSCKVESEPKICGRGFNAYKTIAECCTPGKGAFQDGCTDPSKPVTCFVAGGYWPRQQCVATSDLAVCSRNWGRWNTESECCAAGAAFTDGCTKARPCWVANAWHPRRTCGLTTDQELCQRGWGAYDSEQMCCQPGAAHSSGCGAVEEATDV